MTIGGQTAGHMSSAIAMWMTVENKLIGLGHTNSVVRTDLTD